MKGRQSSPASRGSFHPQEVLIHASLALVFLVTGCASSGPRPSQEVTPASYASAKGKGLVVVSAGWGRVWKCGPYENAQLRTIGFDRLTLDAAKDGAPAEVVLDGSSGKPGTYALVLEPGEYALTTFSVKVASSTNDVKIATADRTRLIQDGKPVGGTFTVRAEEVVYIGHFGLDCHKEPVLWRYYLSDRHEFERYKQAVQKQYPFLNTDQMKFRLFNTSQFGQPFELQ